MARTAPDRTPLAAGVVYGLAAFAIGFVLGAIRVLVIEPAIGALPAVLIETPVMLALSWFLCGALIQRLQVAPDFIARLTMGGVGFLVLMAFEIGLGAFGFGRSFEALVDAMLTPAGLTGLAAQIAFGLLPLVR